MAGTARGEAGQRGSRRVVPLALVAIALVAVVVVAFVVARVPSPLTNVVGLEAGEIAPDFTITDVNGTGWSPHAHLGDVVLIDFMGVRCTVCDSEMRQGTLQSAYRNYSARGLSILSVDVGTALGTTNATEAWRFIHGVGVDGSRWEPGAWPIALDTQGLATMYRSHDMLPMKYLVDRTGRIAWTNLGLTSPAEIDAAVLPLL